MPLRSLSTGFIVAGAIGALLTTACQDGGREALDFRFDIPRSEAFPARLSDYGLYAEPMANLAPAASVVEYELSAPLFTDYSRKQRLLRLPADGTMDVVDGLSSRFPEGTVVAKTFYYPQDFRDASLGWDVVETRLLVMRGGQWNVATYIWNEAQTDAVLALDGEQMRLEWISATGDTRSTDYEVPSEVACVTCHQRDGEVELIGLRPRNLNLDVLREGATVNQLEHLDGQGLLSGVPLETLSRIPAYENAENELEARARSYLDANCAHCHNPDGWRRPARRDFDFRFETPLADTGLLGKQRDVEAVLVDGEMPYIGTTLVHDEGVDLVLSYLGTL